jgi:hypothetical protein
MLAQHAQQLLSIPPSPPAGPQGPPIQQGPQ